MTFFHTFINQFFWCKMQCTILTIRENTIITQIFHLISPQFYSLLPPFAFVKDQPPLCYLTARYTTTILHHSLTLIFLSYYSLLFPIFFLLFLFVSLFFLSTLYSFSIFFFFLLFSFLPYYSNREKTAKTNKNPRKKHRNKRTGEFVGKTKTSPKNFKARKQLTLDNLPIIHAKESNKTIQRKQITITEIQTIIKEAELALKVGFKLFPS